MRELNCYEQQTVSGAGILDFIAQNHYTASMLFCAVQIARAAIIMYYNYSGVCPAGGTQESFYQAVVPACAPDCKVMLVNNLVRYY